MNDGLELALYAYHNCEFSNATRHLERMPPSAEAAQLRIKSLCELDQASLAKAYADLAQRDFETSGSLHYYRGMANYLAGADEKAIASAFQESIRHGFAGGHRGLAFLAYAARDSQRAMQELELAQTSDMELEHVRLLMMFQVELDAARFDGAEAALGRADQLLKENPSLLRTLWGQLCWVRLLQATRCFEVGHVAAQRLLMQLSSDRTPRLYRNAKELEEKMRAEDGSSQIHLPAAHDWKKTFRPEEINRKPMLNALYRYLGERGDQGATKEDIVTRVWEQSYNPLVHDDRLYKAIGRLRKLLGDDAECPQLLYQRGNQYILDAVRSTTIAPEVSL